MEIKQPPPDAFKLPVPEKTPVAPVGEETSDVVVVLLEVEPVTVVVEAELGPVVVEAELGAVVVEEELDAVVATAAPDLGRYWMPVSGQVLVVPLGATGMNVPS